MTFCKNCMDKAPKGQLRTIYKSQLCQDCNKLICHCGKAMYELKDSKTGKFNGYKWRCDCMPKNMAIAVL